MAEIKPFAALRPKPDLADQIAAPPYDVLSSSEARAMAADNPLSFLHVSKAEIDLDPSIDAHDPRVYRQAQSAFHRLIKQGALEQDDRPHLYVYRQTMGDRSQTGIVAAVSCADYENRVVRRHELTLQAKENDRLQHIEALSAQTGPAFLFYPPNQAVARVVQKAAAAAPQVDLTAADGVRHTVWTIHEQGEMEAVVSAFQEMGPLYIADGHHRTAAAVRVWKNRQSGPDKASAYFLAVSFPWDQLKILPYNRAVRDLNGLTAEKFVEAMERLGSWEAAENGVAARHDLRVFLSGKWHRFRWRADLPAQEDEAGRLDVALLQKHVLTPLLGIDNPRTSPKISFLGGIRGPGMLEDAVKSGEFALAFSLCPVTAQDIMAVVDKGGVMPPKSTWFEPKLRDGLFSYLIEA
ncbi:MAG: DUF1015 family protein [Verrucomicrobiae bacterium]|nr:DUF1015 family protein [Verrucomicrobiae bacterium]